MSDWTINTKLADSLRAKLPRPLFSLARNWATALLTPVLFSKRSGHFKSSLRSKSVDRAKDPIPWYTYPCIDFLSGKNYDARRVLEFGAGHSTLWWMKRAEHVCAIEGSAEWARYLQRQVRGNVHIHLMLAANERLESVLGGKKFDVIVIDGVDGTGCNRAQAAHYAVDLDLLTDGGAIILDDSEGSFDTPGNDWQKAAYNCDLLRSRGFSRVDFFGYAPAQLQWRCTSLFFKGHCFLFDQPENPRKSDV